MAPKIRFRNRNPDPESKDLITSPNLASMEAFVSDLHSDKERTDRIISFCTRHYPNTLSLKLSHISLSSLHLRAAAFDVFARALRSAEPKFHITPMILAEIKPHILECLRQESSRNPPSKVLSKIVSGISFWVHRDSERIRGQWPELLDFVASSITASDDNRALQEWGLFVFRYLPERFVQRLNQPHFGVISTAILRKLSSSDMVIRAAAIRASVTLVKSCTRYRELRELLPQFVTSVVDLLSSGHRDLAGKALRTLVHIAMEEPGFFTEQMEFLFGSMVRIAEQGDIGEEMRAEAVQVLRELEDGAGEEMKKMMENLRDEAVERFVRLMVNFLEYVERETYWYRGDGVVSEQGENTEERRTILMGTYFLDRMSFIHKGKVLPIVIRLARECVREQEWKKRHAGITAIAMITEGCSEAMIDHLDEVLMLTLGLFRDFHARVRAAAINTLRVVSLDLSPTIQDRYHDKILPALASLAGDPLTPNLQVQAAIAFVFFSRGCKPDYFTPFLDGLLRRLLTTCQSPYQRVQEWGFQALASLAASSESNFNQVYDYTMAHLKEILSQNADNFAKLVCAKCLECLSNFGGAVGKERLSSDSVQVMDTLMSLQGSLQMSDHGIRICIFQALANLINCLGEDLSPYVPDLMPILLHSSQLYNPGVIDASSNPSNKIDGVKEKAMACKVLYCMARQLRKSLFPWIMKVASALVPVLQFSEHPETREIVTAAMPELLHSAMLISEKGKSQTNTNSFIQKLVVLVVPALSEALELETRRTMCRKILSTICKCIYVSGPVFSRAQGSAIANGIKEVLAAISRRDQDPENEDEEGFEIDPEENVEELELEIVTEVTNCLCSLVKRFRIGFLPYFDQLAVYIPMMWDDRRNPKEKAMGFSIFRNVVEQCGVAAQKYFDMYLPCVLKCCKDGDPSVRQEAVLGIGACAESGDAVFRTRVGAALESLEAVIAIGHQEAPSPENDKTFDAAVSALGKICRFHRNSINAPAVVPIWLSYLPLARDLDEAKIVHDQLCLMVEMRDYDLFGPDNQNLPIIIAVLEEILEQQEDLATKETAKRMTVVLPRLRSEANL